MSGQPDGRSGIGARLRAGRERAGLTLLQAAERLHVDAGVLEALEIEDFDALGAPVYVRGHIRRYAQLVGESEGALQDLYASRIHPQAPDLTRIPHQARAAQRRALLVPGLVTLIGFTLVGTLWWAVRELAGARGGETVPPAAAGANSAARPVRTAATAPASSAATVLPTPGVNAAAPVRTPAAEPTHAKRLTLRFAAESWTEVYDSSGRRLFYDNAAGGSVRTFSGTPPLRVVLGNAPAVTVEVDGAPARIPDAARGRKTARFTVSRSGRLAGARTSPDGVMN